MKALRVALAALPLTALALARSQQPTGASSPPADNSSAHRCLLLGGQAGNDTHSPGKCEKADVDQNPIPLNTVEAEFSDEARRAHYEGVVIVSVLIDKRGFPVKPQVVRPVGMGLDEKAIQAAEKYRFKPAMKNGRPVAKRITIEVNFHAY